MSYDKAIVSKHNRNVKMFELAVVRLKEYFQNAEQSRLWGVVAIEITFEDGEVRYIHRRLTGRDKDPY